MKTDSTNSIGRLQLFIRDEAVRKGLIQPGHYGIPESDEKIMDLGDSVDLIPLARRPRAIDMSKPKAPIVSFDIDSKDFQRIVANAGDPKSRCQYGISLLVYERSTGRFLEFFCGDKPSRIEAKKIFLCLPLTEADIAARRLIGETAHAALPLTLNVNRRGSWYFPQVAKCLTPVILPNWGIVDNRIAEFINEGREESLRRISQAATRRLRNRIGQQTKASPSAAKREGARTKQTGKKIKPNPTTD